MPPTEEQIRRDLTAQWIHKAEQDLKSARFLLQRKPPLLYPSCFHAQQAGEKYLKAFLTNHQIDFPKTHVIGELLDLVAKVDFSLTSRLADATVLTPVWR